MQLALLSGASPITCKEGPVVRLQAGVWEFMVDGLIDSLLNIYHNSQHSEQIIHGRQFTLHEATEVRAIFNSRGSERYITVNIKKVA